MTKARIGVIGAGWWATQFHIPSLKTYEKADLVGIADVKPEKAAAAADYYDIGNTYDDHRELLAAGVDGVVIAVQHAYHYEVARDALDAGVHVLVEKPMTLTAADAWDLVDRAKRSGLHLMVGYTYQFTRHAQAAREIVRSGKIGDLQLVSGIFTSWVESYLRGRPQDYAEAFAFPVTGPEPDSYSDPRLAGGGQGHLQVTHPMGMALWVTGRRAREVFAYMESYDLDVDLVDSFSYRLDNGASGTMASTGAMRPNQQLDQGFVYAGSGGFVRQDMAGGRLEAHYNDGTSEQFEDLSEDELYPAHLPSRTLADLALGNGENRAPGEFGARVVEFLEAGYRSAASGSPVKVDSLL
jgi:predicted dehydrogenase